MVQNASHPPKLAADIFPTRPSMGEKKPTKVMPVKPAKEIHRTCLADLRANFCTDHGARASFICCMRLPSVSRSIQTKISVHTVCGQARPHHKRPARAVKKNSDRAAMMSSHVSSQKSCGNRVRPKIKNLRAGRSKSTACRPFHCSHGNP